MLLQTPLAALEWCPDPQALPLLHSPEFVAASSAVSLSLLGPRLGICPAPFLAQPRTQCSMHAAHGLQVPSGWCQPARSPAPACLVLIMNPNPRLCWRHAALQTLRSLGPIPLAPGLDLSPFTRLTELHLCPAAGLPEWRPPATAGPAGAASDQPSITLPGSLALLGLQGLGGHYEAGGFTALTQLRELRLGGFSTCDLRALPRSVRSVTISNPCQRGRRLRALDGRCIQLPDWGAEASAAGPGGSPDDGSGSSSGGGGEPLRGGKAAALHRRLVALLRGRARPKQPQGQAGRGQGQLPQGQLVEAAAGGSPGSKAERPALHLHFVSAQAGVLAVDLSWALAQPALRVLTIAGSHIRRDQALILHLSGGWCLGREATAAAELSCQLAQAPALEELAMHPGLGRAVLRPKPPKLLRRMGLGRCQLPLAAVLSAAAKPQTGKARGCRGTGACGPSSVHVAVESYVAAESGSEACGAEGTAWVCGVREGAGGFRLRREAAAA